MLIARQPIFLKNGQVFGYELLYREHGNTSYSCEDGNIATSSVIAGNFLSYDMNELFDDKKVFINFTQELIHQDIATLFPIESLIIEVMDMDMPSVEILDACRRLKSFGYPLAVGDFIFRKGYEELAYLADIIKVNFMDATDAQKATWIKKYKNNHVQFLAEKVETNEEYQKAIQLGYVLFQGYFFAKPVIVPFNTLVPNKLSALKLIQVLSDSEPEFEALTSVIESDVAFSYEILKIVNSAFFSRGRNISSIRQALVRLGIYEVRKWGIIASMRKLADESQNELIQISMIRSKFMELFSKKTNNGHMSSSYMTVGILSMLDVLTNSEMERVLNSLSLSEDIRSTLLQTNPNSDLSLCYNLILHCERGQWKDISEIATKIKIPLKTIADTHHEAIIWTLDFNKRVLYGN